MLLSPRRKIWIIIHLFTSGSSTSFLSYAEISVDLCWFCPLPSIWEKGAWTQFSGCQCQIFASSTKFSMCIWCMSRFLPVVPRPLPTISRTVVSFATVYTDWQSGSTFISSTHVGGVGGHSTKVTEIIIRTISAPVATFATS